MSRRGFLQYKNERSRSKPIKIKMVFSAVYYSFVPYSYKQLERKIQLDLAFNNVKPKDWYFVLD